jgi:transposase
VKSEESYRLGLLLTQQHSLKRKFLDIENAIRHSIKTFGLKVGKVSRGQFEARVRDLVAGDPLIAGLTECMLRARAALWQGYLRLHNMVLAIVRRDELCRRRSARWASRHRSMIYSVPPLEDGRSLSQDDVAAAAVGHGDRRAGHISMAGDGDVRHPLYEAANVMLARY